MGVWIDSFSPKHPTEELARNMSPVVRSSRTFPWHAKIAASCILALVGVIGFLSPAEGVSGREEQIRYAFETVGLRNDRYMTRKANFLSEGCAQVASCRKPYPYNEFDWSTDGCSWTPSSLRALFNPACQEHDFGYRNFGKGLKLGRDENTRRWIDDRFRAEMKSICNYRFSAWWQYANLQTCFKEADTMWAIVRHGSDWS